MNNLESRYYGLIRTFFRLFLQGYAVVSPCVYFCWRATLIYRLLGRISYERRMVLWPVIFFYRVACRLSSPPLPSFYRASSLRAVRGHLDILFSPSRIGRRWFWLLELFLLGSLASFSRGAVPLRPPRLLRGVAPLPLPSLLTLLDLAADSGGDLRFGLSLETYFLCLWHCAR